MDNRPAHTSLERLADEIAELRPLPACAIRILDITEGDRFSAHDLAAIIATDQAVTARLLRLANSAFYGFPRRITTVRDAVVLLGFHEVRSVTVSACVIHVAPGDSNLDQNAFWQFSLTVAMLGEILARTEGVHRDYAFTAGVLHNIGRLALDQSRPEALAHAIEAARSGAGSLHEAQRQTLGFTDAELGARLAERWNFPPPLVDTIENHATALHQLPDGSSLAAFVARARAFARSYGVPDGIALERGALSDPPPMAEEWLTPPLSAALLHAGGMQHLQERADTFLGVAVAG